MATSGGVAARSGTAAATGLLLVLSDLDDDEAATQRELRHIVQRGHDAAMLQVVAREERTLAFKEQLELRDLESGETRVIDPISAGAAYRENVAQFLERWRSFAQHDGIDYALFDTGDAPERALRDDPRACGAASLAG